MRLLISDANILIDMEAGALMETLFQLPMQFGIPDLLYYEEIEPGSPGLEGLGLQVMEVSGDFVAYAEQLPGRPTNGSHHNFSKHSHSLGQCKEVPRRSFSALTSLQNKSCRRCLACKIHLRDNLRTGRDFKTAFCFKLVTRWFQINLLLVAT